MVPSSGNKQRKHKSHDHPKQRTLRSDGSIRAAVQNQARSRGKRVLETFHLLRRTYQSGFHQIPRRIFTRKIHLSKLKLITHPHPMNTSAQNNSAVEPTPECVFIQSAEYDCCYQCGRTRKQHMQPPAVDLYDQNTALLARVRELEQALHGALFFVPIGTEARKRADMALDKPRNLSAISTR